MAGAGTAWGQLLRRSNTKDTEAAQRTAPVLGFRACKAQELELYLFPPPALTGPGIPSPVCVSLKTPAQRTPKTSFGSNNNKQASNKQVASHAILKRYFCRCFWPAFYGETAPISGSQEATSGRFHGETAPIPATLARFRALSTVSLPRFGGPGRRLRDASGPPSTVRLPRFRCPGRRLREP